MRKSWYKRFARKPDYIYPMAMSLAGMENTFSE